MLYFPSVFSECIRYVCSVCGCGWLVWSKCVFWGEQQAKQTKQTNKIRMNWLYGEALVGTFSFRQLANQQTNGSQQLLNGDAVGWQCDDVVLCVTNRNLEKLTASFLWSNLVFVLAVYFWQQNFHFYSYGFRHSGRMLRINVCFVFGTTSGFTVKWHWTFEQTAKSPNTNRVSL